METREILKTLVLRKKNSGEFDLEYIRNKSAGKASCLKWLRPCDYSQQKKKQGKKKILLEKETKKGLKKNNKKIDGFLLISQFDAREKKTGNWFR